MDIKDFSSGNFFVTGELGSGKTLFAMQLIREYMRAGRPVATNVDVFLDEMMLPESKKVITRLPDKPAIRHFEQLGASYDLADGYDEDKFGLIVLDECLTWLNTRGYNDKERPQVVNFFLHARKKGWNVCFILQSIDYADKQVVDTLLTYHVTCVKVGKFKAPFIGKLFNIRLPKGTMATIHAGRAGATSIKFGREIYRGSDLYKCYNTAQVFNDGKVYNPKIDDFIDTRANATLLSAWHLKGRYLEQSPLAEIDFKQLFDKFLYVLFTKYIRAGVILLFRFFTVGDLRRQAWALNVL